MGFLDGLFENKANKAKAKDVIARATSGFQTTSTGIASFGKDWDIDRAITMGYERVNWVFRCVQVIASSQANIPIDLKKFNVTDKGQIVDNPNVYALLNRRPNPYQDSKTFRFMLSAQLLLSTKGAFIEVVRTASGEVNALYLLPPGSVEPVPHPKKFVEGYLVTDEYNSQSMLKPDDVIWIRAYPHPVDPYRQVPPLVTARLAAETDYLAHLFNRNFLKNDGRPGLLISLKGDIAPEDAQEIRDRFEGGSGTAGRTMFVESDGMDVVDMTRAPRDVQWAEAVSGSKADILAAFGVPESVLGNAAGRCLRATELVHLSDGTVQEAQSLIGRNFKLLQPTVNGTIEVDAVASDNGKADIYRITTFSGRTLETNSKHPLYMSQVKENGRFKSDVSVHGWTPMQEIKDTWDRNDCHSSEVFTEVAVPTYFPQSYTGAENSELAYDAGVDGQIVPDWVFTSSYDDQVSYLSGLYNTHGRLSQHTSFDLQAPTYPFAQRLQRLLLRVGVYSTIGVRKETHVVTVSSKLNMLNFLALLELNGKAEKTSRKVFNRLSTETMIGPALANSEGLPEGLMWDKVLKIEKIGVDTTVAVTVPEGHTYLSLFWEHNTYDNADSELVTFWNIVMKTHCDAIASGLDTVTGIVGDDLYLEYDYTVVPVLQDAERRRLDKIANDFSRGVISLDDFRKALGKPTLNVPGSRVMILPNGMIVGAEDDVAYCFEHYFQSPTTAMNDANDNPFTSGGYENEVRGGTGAYKYGNSDNPFQGGSTGGNGTVGGQGDLVNSEAAASGGSATMTVNQVAARALRSAQGAGTTPDAVAPAAAPEVAERISQVRQKALSLSSVETKNVGLYSASAAAKTAASYWAAAQSKVYLQRLEHSKVRKGTRHWVGDGEGTKSLDANYIVPDNDGSDMYNAIISNLNLSEKSAKAVRALVTRHANTLITSVRDYIQEADQNGYELDEIGTGIEALMANSGSNLPVQVENVVKG